MEIHAPHKPILTLREALVHLAIVTVGILIALSFEGVREYYEHRALAAEARENITREIADNARELDGFLKGIPKLDTDIDHALEVLKKIHPGEELKDESVHLGYSLSSLSTASRTTAEITGAFSYMAYDDVKKYAAVYDLQSKFVKLQDESMMSYTSALGQIAVFGAAASASPADITSIKRSLEAMGASLYVQRQLGEALAKAYKEASAGQ